MLYIASKHRPKSLVSYLTVLEPYLNEHVRQILALFVSISYYLQDLPKKDAILLRICLTIQNVLAIMRCGDSIVFARLQEILISLIMKQSQPVSFTSYKRWQPAKCQVQL